MCIIYRRAEGEVVHVFFKSAAFGTRLLSGKDTESVFLRQAYYSRGKCLMKALRYCLSR